MDRRYLRDYLELEKILGSRIMYSSRSVDFRGLWSERLILWYPPLVVNFSEWNIKYSVCYLLVFQKTTKRLVCDGWIELKKSGCRCHFRTFQLELDNLGTKNFENGSVVEKLQPFEVERISVPMVQISMKFGNEKKHSYIRIFFIPTFPWYLIFFGF